VAGESSRRSVRCSTTGATGAAPPSATEATNEGSAPGAGAADGEDHGGVSLLTGPSCRGAAFARGREMEMGFGAEHVQASDTESDPPSRGVHRVELFMHDGGSDTDPWHRTSVPPRPGISANPEGTWTMHCVCRVRCEHMDPANR